MGCYRPVCELASNRVQSHWELSWPEPASTKLMASQPSSDVPEENGMVTSLLYLNV